MTINKGKFRERLEKNVGNCSRKLNSFLVKELLIIRNGMRLQIRRIQMKNILKKILFFLRIVLSLKLWKKI
jgi:hypothetical protein